MRHDHWAPIQGYVGAYEVSTDGQVRGVERKSTVKRFLRKVPGKRLTPYDTGNGYLAVGLMKDGKKKHFKVHRLVAEAFIPNPRKKPQVNHLDGDRTNNVVTNLEWCTASENMSHSFYSLGRVGAHLGKSGSSHHSSKAVIGTNMETGKQIFFESANLANSAGYNSGAVCQCCRGKKKQYKGYVWIYASEVAA